MLFSGLIEQFLDDPGLKNDPKQRPIRLPLHQSYTFLSTEAASSCKLQFMLTVILCGLFYCQLKCFHATYSKQRTDI